MMISLDLASVHFLHVPLLISSSLLPLATPDGLFNMLQAYASEPQRAESPPTPAVPPVSYFLTKEPVVTSYITPLPQPVPMPGPPAQAPMQQAYASQGKSHPRLIYHSNSWVSHMDVTHG